jgi:hypothetical protein
MQIPASEVEKLQIFSRTHGNYRDDKLIVAEIPDD